MSQKVLCIVTFNSKYNTGALTFENLRQRGGALGTLHRTATYKTRFHLLHLALKHLTTDCTSRGTPQVGGGGGGDRAVVEMSDVCVMPLKRPVVEAFARCY